MTLKQAGQLVRAVALPDLPSPSPCHAPPGNRGTWDSYICHEISVSRRYHIGLQCDELQHELALLSVLGLLEDPNTGRTYAHATALPGLVVHQTHGAVFLGGTSISWRSTEISWALRWFSSGGAATFREVVEGGALTQKG